jgi:hypothetical protein
MFVVLYCCLSVMIGGDDILEGLRDRWWRGFGEEVVF